MPLLERGCSPLDCWRFTESSAARPPRAGDPAGLPPQDRLDHYRAGRERLKLADGRDNGRPFSMCRPSKWSCSMAELPQPVNYRLIKAIPPRYARQAVGSDPRGEAIPSARRGGSRPRRCATTSRRHPRAPLWACRPCRSGNTTGRRPDSSSPSFSRTRDPASAGSRA
jgi:hypothetical protein